MGKGYDWVWLAENFITIDGKIQAVEREIQRLEATTWTQPRYSNTPVETWNS
ncbi:MAG: hypothetical protein Ct9H300mP23_10770 [Nitrospinota bacterium]|nr:MAG: hypothetical protein Ct9H300mP23_10770 [Nitrospinota bacterium]